MNQNVNVLLLVQTRSCVWLFKFHSVISCICRCITTYYVPSESRWICFNLYHTCEL